MMRACDAQRLFCWSPTPPTVGDALQDMVREYLAYDSEPGKYFKKYTGVNSRTKAEFTVDVG
jgi:hypothetical protein